MLKLRRHLPAPQTPLRNTSNRACPARKDKPEWCLCAAVASQRTHSRSASLNRVTTFADRPNTALVVIDAQHDVIGNAHDRDAVVGRIVRLVDQARAKAVPVVWVQHNDDDIVKGSDGWQLVDELMPAEGEPVVHKHYRSAFESTDLDSVLADLRVGTVVLCGAETAFCMRHTTHGALERGYDVTIVADAHTGNSFEWNGASVDATKAIEEMNLTYDGYALPGRGSKVLAADAVFAG